MKKIFAIIMALCLALALGACNIGSVTAMRGNGNVVEQTIAIDEHEPGFSLEIRNVSFQGNFRDNPSIVIDESLGHEVVITTDNNIAELITVNQNDGAVVISAGRAMRFAPTQLTITTGLPITSLDIGGAWEITHNCTRVTDFSARISGSVRGAFAFNELDDLSLVLSGSGRISMRGAAENFRLTLSGSGRLEAFDLIAAAAEITISGSGRSETTIMDQLNATITGSGRIAAQGSAQEARLHIAGSGQVEAFDLTAETANVTVSGSGRAELTVTEELDATVSGSGRITYDGRPRVNQRVSGSGRITQR